MASYRVDISPEARAEIRQLPGNMRQRTIRLLRDLETAPRPHTSKALEISELAITMPDGSEARRIRVDAWRIIYIVEDELERILILAVRKRPPYRYEDLERLLEDLG